MKPDQTTTKSLLCVIVIVLLGSCVSPKAIVRMSPVSSEVRWNYGQAFAADTVNGIMVESAFDKATKEYNIFDVKIVNGSNMNYLVDPINFHIVDVESRQGQASVFNALDPEMMILSLDKQLSQAEVDAKKAAIGAGIALGVLTVATIALAATDDNHSDHYHCRTPAPELYLAAPLAVDMMDDDVPYDYVSTADRTRNMWETSTVRKTTLVPGYLVEGKIFFSRFEKPGVYMLRLMVDDQLIEIPFTQLNLFP